MTRVFPQQCWRPRGPRGRVCRKCLLGAQQMLTQSLLPGSWGAFRELGVHGPRSIGGFQSSLHCAGKVTSHLARGTRGPRQGLGPGVTPQTGAEPGLLAPRDLLQGGCFCTPCLCFLLLKFIASSFPPLGKSALAVPGAPHSPRVLWSPERPSLLAPSPPPRHLSGSACLSPNPRWAHWDQELCSLRALRNECLMEL